MELIKFMLIFKFGWRVTSASLNPFFFFLIVYLGFVTMLSYILNIYKYNFVSPTMTRVASSKEKLRALGLKLKWSELNPSSITT